MRSLPAFAAALMLAAGVSAAVSAVTARLALDRVPRIASVRLSNLTADFIVKTLRQEGNNREALGAAREWSRRFEEALARVSARRGVVILTSGAVAAGARDLTREVEAAMAELASRKGPPKKEEKIK